MSVHSLVWIKFNIFTSLTPRWIDYLQSWTLVGRWFRLALRNQTSFRYQQLISPTVVNWPIFTWLTVNSNHFLAYITHIKETLRILNLSNNDIKRVDLIYSVIFFRLEVLILENNWIHHFDLQMLSMPSLRYVKLSFNLVTEMSHPEALALNHTPGKYEGTSISLAYFYLTHSQLRSIPNLSDEKETLKILSLSNNHIERVDAIYGVLFSRLSYLYLDHNWIHHFELQMLNMPDLEYVNLTSNLITELAHPEVMALNRTLENPWRACITLEINDNPWGCPELSLSLFGAITLASIHCSRCSANEEKLAWRFSCAQVTNVQALFCRGASGLQSVETILMESVTSGKMGLLLSTIWTMCNIPPSARTRTTHRHRHGHRQRHCSRHRPTINNYGHMLWQPRNWTPTSLVWCRQNKAGRKHCPLPACLAHLFQNNTQ